MIPDGQTVLMDVSPPELFFLLVEGALVFDRTNLTLDVWYFLMLGGSLEVGTEAEPFEQFATITLHGDRYTNLVLPDVGSKMLVAYNRNQVDPDEFATDNPGSTMNMNMAVAGTNIIWGVINIHGQRRMRSWTKVGYLLTCDRARQSCSSPWPPLCTGAGPTRIHCCGLIPAGGARRDGWNVLHSHR